MQGLRTCIYLVNDLTQATEWYSDAFKVQPYFNEPFYVGFSIGGYELGLQPSEVTANEKNSGSKTYWGVNDVHKEYARLIELGATEHGVPTNVGGEIVVASVLDPWGNLLGIIYNPDFKSN